MIERVVATLHPSGEPDAVQPKRVGLRSQGNNDAEGLPKHSTEARRPVSADPDDTFLTQKQRETPGSTREAVVSKLAGNPLPKDDSRSPTMCHEPVRDSLGAVPIGVYGLVRPFSSLLDTRGGFAAAALETKWKRDFLCRVVG
jgi:hypothetical protein